MFESIYLASHRYCFVFSFVTFWNALRFQTSSCTVADSFQRESVFASLIFNGSQTYILTYFYFYVSSSPKHTYTITLFLSHCSLNVAVGLSCLVSKDQLVDLKLVKGALACEIAESELVRRTEQDPSIYIQFDAIHILTTRSFEVTILYMFSANIYPPNIYIYMY